MKRTKTYIATLSGGKDSTVMVDLLLKNNYPVDYIIFSDTLAEFDEMYQYIDKLKKHLKERYNKEVITLLPRRSLEESMLRKVGKKKSKHFGKIKGIHNPLVGFCEWRREAKIAPLKKWLRVNKITNYKLYIGYTTDETHRKSKVENNHIYPLVDYFRMSENDCKQYLVEHDMENPLYRHFNRTGCYFCPAQSEAGYFNIWKHYPKKWQKMLKMEKKLKEAQKNGEKVISDRHKSNIYLVDLEKKFEKADKQGVLFDFSDEPLRDCFCKH